MLTQFSEGLDPVRVAEVLTAVAFVAFSALAWYRRREASPPVAVPPVTSQRPAVADVAAVPPNGSGKGIDREEVFVLLNRLYEIHATAGIDIEERKRLFLEGFERLLIEGAEA